MHEYARNGDTSSNRWTARLRLPDSTRDIKTMAARMSRKLSPHTACISAAALELEKQRHTQEMTTLLQRVAELNARLQQIANEQGKMAEIFLPGILGNKTGQSTSGKKTRLKISPEVNAGILKIRY